jgi:acyl dehydratase
MTATAPPHVITNHDELDGAVGKELGTSAWFEVSQADVDAFAQTTGDRYWIHTDSARAARSPLGGTIAHGLFTLALGPRLMDELVAFDGFSVRMNLGYDRVRFPAPLPVGSRVRMRAVIEGAERGESGTRVRVTQTFECEGAGRPVCVAQFLLHLGA